MKFLEKIAKKKILRIINEWDPEDFINLGANVDEYMPEVNMIYYGLKNNIEDTVYYTFRFYQEVCMQEDFSLEDIIESKALHFPEYTRYDVFECREIEAILKKKLWWLIK